MASNHLVGGSNPSGCTLDKEQRDAARRVISAERKESIPPGAPNKQPSAPGWGFFICVSWTIGSNPCSTKCGCILDKEQRDAARRVISAERKESIPPGAPNKQPSAPGWGFFICVSWTIGSNPCSTKCGCILDKEQRDAARRVISAERKESIPPGAPNKQPSAPGWGFFICVSWTIGSKNKQPSAPICHSFRHTMKISLRSV